MKFSQNTWQWDTETEETFCMVFARWNVRKAKEILSQRKRVRIMSVNVAKWHDAWLADEDGFGPVYVDHDRIRETPDEFDVDVPLIGIQDHTGSMIIDGWHRLAIARARGIESLDCIVLSKSDSAKVREA